MENNTTNDPLGYFQFCLGIDCETSGIGKGSLDPTIDVATGKKYQAVSYGLLIIETKTLNVLDELYVEIKWNGESEWSSEAEAIHGLSKEYLEKNGLDEQDAIVAIGEFVLKYFGPTNNIPLLGHNVGTFDRYFIDDLFKRYGLKMKFGNRHIDTTTLGVVLLNLFHSDQIFNYMGLKERTTHNALEDIKYTVEVAKSVRTLWDAFVTPQIQG